MEQDKTYNDEIDLFELFQKLYERRWIIIGITAFTTVLAILVSVLMPKTYKAEAIVEVRNISVLEILGGIKLLYEATEDKTLKKLLKKVEVYTVVNNIAKIGVVKGASPQLAKENLEKVIELINKKLFLPKIEEINKNFNIRLSSIDQTIRDITSGNRTIYDPSKYADLVTERGQILRWLQNPEFVVLLTEIQTSSKPVKPKPLLYTSIGFITGLFLGIFVALVLEAIKSRRMSINRPES
ncbi:MAG: Wzz/FepE/Etk N-terminal domain-containing protein [Thermodesulfobacteriaceae bacterium]|jgi:LPS O-antigen subunit length determinant protein (WzzB/FepE family)